MTITESRLLSDLEKGAITVDEALELVKTGAAKLDPRSREPGDTWESKEKRGWETSSLPSVLTELGFRDRTDEFEKYRE